MKEKTWRQHYAPLVWAEIVRITLQQPDITMKRLRWELGQLNPGQYGHMKKIWANEATKQVKRYSSMTGKEFIKNPPTHSGQQTLF